ncbi:tetratricopeptide repeat protein [Pedobacter nyackensis]|uniref:tetratricopeptide repeat protein n=1 Tax=Pedobacter nyackensis TaxID=475255 RepID=UPI00117D1FCA|nr:tetratricopeptide repeat protein [Pedobacter nyackensis]
MNLKFDRDVKTGTKLKLVLIFIAIFFVQTDVNAQSDSTIQRLKELLNRSQSVENRLRLTLLLSEELYKPTPTQALEYANESERLAKSLGADSLLNRAYISQATAYISMGDYPHALQLLLKSIRAAKKNGDSHLLFSAYEMTGILFYFQNDQKRALQYFFKALEQYSIKKPTHNKQIERKAYLLNNMGILYNQKKMYTPSAYYFHEALSLAKHLNNHELIANVLNNQGTLYADQGKTDTALKQYLEAIEIRKRNDHKWGLTQSYISVGKFYYKLNDYNASETYFKKAIETARQIESLHYVGVSSFYLFQLYKQKGDYKHALEAIELSKKVNDTLYNEKRTREIGRLETQFHLDLKQAELAAKQREKNLYFILAAASLGLSLIVATLLFYLQKSKVRSAQLEQANLQSEKKNLEKDIELKDKELTTQVLHLVHKNELIHVISEKLLEINHNLDIKSRMAVQNLITDLQSNLQPELFEEFKLRIQHIHEDFYNILNKKFPNLSSTELRLCAFLKLNLTTKEISAITNTSVKSIEIARTRLRKKLNLTGTDQNLIIFLSQLDQTQARN